MDGQKCKCPHHKMLPIFVIVFGLTYLLRNLGILTVPVADVILPVIIILIGAQWMMKGACKCCSK